MLRVTTALLALTLAAPAMADGLSYNYLQGGYQRIELDDSGFDIDGDGIGFGGSFEIGEHMYVFASYATADFDFGVDLNTLAAGLGYHAGISENADFFFNLAYVNAEAEASGFGSADESGVGASIGIRSMMTDRVELFGNISYTDLGEGADETSVGGGAWFSLTDNFAIGANVELDENVATFGATARLYFGQ